MQYLTPKETWLLSVLYRLEEADVEDILNDIEGRYDYKYTTIECMLINLFKKQYVTRVKSGRRYRYTPREAFPAIFQEVVEFLFGEYLPQKNIDFLSECTSYGVLTEKDKGKLKSVLKATQPKKAGGKKKTATKKRP